MAKTKTTAAQKVARKREQEQTADILRTIIEQELTSALTTILEDFDNDVESSISDFAKDRAQRLSFAHCGYRRGNGGIITYLTALRAFAYEARFAVHVPHSEQLGFVDPDQAA